MSKTINITVTDSEDPENPQILNLEYEGETPTLEEWSEILAFEDEHVGGRPTDR